MKFSKNAVLAVVGACMSSTQVAMAADVPADARPVGPFVLCDGRVGHVSDGARFGRLLLVMGTAGLSEAGMKSDDFSKRATGMAGVAACDEAIGKESDAYRRIQLGLARAIHFGEDKKWSEAALAARDVTGLLRDHSIDWGLSTSTTGAAKYLEALYLARAGQVAAADDAVWSGITADPYNVVLMMRIVAMAGLSGTMNPTKQTALERMLQINPSASGMIANVYTQAGDDANALRALHVLEASTRAFVKPEKYEPFKDAVASRYAISLSLRGDAAGARAQLGLAEAALERRRARGDAARDATSFAAAEDNFAFARAATLSVEGRNAEAAELLNSRGSWPTVAPFYVSRLVGKVATAIPASARKGIVATGEAGLAKQSLDARLAVLRDYENEKRLYNIDALSQDEELAKLAAQAWTGSDKPKWLLKPDKDPLPYDFLSTEGRFAGVASGEGLLLHAALIAKARGKTGFIMAPIRSKIYSVGVRFVNQGEEGMPTGTIVDADSVIRELGPHIRVAAR